MDVLNGYDPILVGTIPIHIDLPELMNGGYFYVMNSENRLMGSDIQQMVAAGQTK
ncbi:hypothetical protein G5B47_06890 [Paenibacillus sp. 7124]|uniref:Uncharacterized protein n=1 Tax=Paenibacillus apii TaxID=1850370 RepID=A0A6M1PIJ6_9BACL|nr:hypothetical protein [Paenibacillus apii]NJJ39270.1 hypothetical protein [Paenibacillus apii]